MAIQEFVYIFLKYELSHELVSRDCVRSLPVKPDARRPENIGKLGQIYIKDLRGLPRTGSCQYEVRCGTRWYRLIVSVRSSRVVYHFPDFPQLKVRIRDSRPTKFIARYPVTREN